MPVLGLFALAVLPLFQDPEEPIWYRVLATLVTTGLVAALIALVVVEIIWNL